MNYHLAPCLDQLRTEINRAFPKRDRRSDGWIGDTSHQARKSDHNPDYAAGGVVRALDIDVDDNDASRDLRAEVLAAAIGDPRVAYVISNGRIYSRRFGWTSRKYTGPNGHFGHVHVSIRHTAAAARDVSPWLDQAAGGAQPKPAADHSVISRTSLIMAARGEPISGQRWEDVLQVAAFAYRRGYIPHTTYTALRKTRDYKRFVPFIVKCIQSRHGLVQDGIFGPKTAAVMQKFGYRIEP